MKNINALSLCFVVVVVAFSSESKANCNQTYDLLQRSSNSNPGQLLQLATNCPHVELKIHSASSLNNAMRPNDALTLLEQAQNIVNPNDSQTLGYIHVIKAESYTLQNYLCKAHSQLMSAKQLLEQETTNPTISEIELKLELKRSEQVLDASTLSCMLQSSRSAVDRGIGFAPSINISINFATNSDQLTPQGMLQAKELADMLIMDDFSDYDIHIVGHADSRGDAFYNQALSERRAMSVKRTLEQISTRLLGILYAKGKGETQLKDTRNTNDAHMINRRVEVLLVAKD